MLYAKKKYKIYFWNFIALLHIDHILYKPSISNSELHNFGKQKAKQWLVVS
jgi:hypothetical protein